MRRLPTLLALASLATLPPPASADELLPATKPAEEIVDHYVDAALKEAKVTPAAPADDATFLRRVTLDLVGRIPTPAETKEYTTSSDPARKAKLVDKLMASPAYARHQADEFDAMLSARPGELREYLRRAFADNRGWDKIFRELLLP